MLNQEEKTHQNNEEVIEIPIVESLLNYECQEDDDGTDWET